jgi:hypothetical protein
MLTTARNKNIQMQRKLRGEHTAVESGPATDTFMCGDIFLNCDNRDNKAVLVEDNRVLLVSTNSFLMEDWMCVSCNNSHQLLPRQKDRDRGDGGQQLIFLYYHNMPAILPSKDGKCPIILRVEGGLLREIGTYFLESARLLCSGGERHHYRVCDSPDGGGEGGLHQGAVDRDHPLHEVLQGKWSCCPLPTASTNDPELIRGILDILSWMEKLQKLLQHLQGTDLRNQQRP